MTGHSQAAAPARKLAPAWGAPAFPDARQGPRATQAAEYTEAELEFMRAMHEYKQSSGRMFPTWSEVLEVLGGLGYNKVAD